MPTTSNRFTLARKLAGWPLLAAAVCALALTGCSGPSAGAGASPSASAGAGMAGAEQAPGGIAGSASGAASGASSSPTELPPPDSGAIALPSVQPAPSGDPFCAAYMAYVLKGGPYDLFESGDKAPAFTQADVDAYKAMDASAPAAIKSVVDSLLTYGEQMNKGDFSHAMDYETALNGATGLTPWVASYCQVKMTDTQPT